MSWIRDLKYAVRGLRKNPTLTAVALVTLALGIGANTAIFSVVQGVLLAPLPYPDADRLVRVWPTSTVSTELLEYYAERTSAFDELSLYAVGTFSVVGEGRPEALVGMSVTSRHFATVGVSPALGRGFTADEEVPGNHHVTVLSHGLWQRRFGGDPEILGSTLLLNGSEHSVVGVMPESYQPLRVGSELWVPLPIDRANELHWDMMVYPLVGRLAPGVTAERATADLRAVVTSYGQEVRPPYYLEKVDGARVVSFKESLIGNVRKTFLVLFGAVGLVLLAACANLASLLLARITARRRELALRGALGATSGHLVTQILVESAVLALAGGVLGLLVASWTLAALVHELPGSVPRTAAIGIDAGALAFTLALALAAGLAVAALPAWKAGRSDLRLALASGGRSVVAGSHRLHHVLIAAEIALAVVLVTGAGLLVKSFHTLQEVDPGFQTAGIHTFRLKPPTATYGDEEARRLYFERVVESVREVPGVEAASILSRLPMTGDVALGFRLPDDETPRSVSVRVMTPELPETLGIPLLAGRPLEESDRAHTPPVGLVNLTLARRLWGDADPVGRRLVFATGELWFTVVGVLGDTRTSRLADATQPQVYRPLGQSAWERRMVVVARAAGTHAPVPAIEAAIWSVDSTVPITGVATLEQLVDRSLRNARFLTTLFSLFAGLALVLGAVGVFGVTSYTVSQQTEANGVRLALGATTGSVVYTAVGRTLVPVAVGLLAGGLLSGWLTRWLASFLFEVRATDPAVFAAVLAVLTGCAALAAWLPARRAGRVDPMVVLRNE